LDHLLNWGIQSKGGNNAARRRISSLRKNRLSAALPPRLHPHMEGAISHAANSMQATSLAFLSTRKGEDELLVHQPSFIDMLSDGNIPLPFAGEV
jgi:hypothetical protein